MKTIERNPNGQVCFSFCVGEENGAKDVIYSEQAIYEIIRGYYAIANKEELTIYFKGNVAITDSKRLWERD